MELDIIEHKCEMCQFVCADFRSCIIAGRATQTSEGFIVFWQRTIDSVEEATDSLSSYSTFGTNNGGYKVTVTFFVYFCIVVLWSRDWAASFKLTFQNDQSGKTICNTVTNQ